MLLVRRLRFAFLVSASQPIKSSRGALFQPLAMTRGKEQAGQGVVLPVKNHILHVLSYGTAETQVVIPGK
jgi:hypothetical protein